MFTPSPVGMHFCTKEDPGVTMFQLLWTLIIHPSDWKWHIWPPCPCLLVESPEACETHTWMIQDTQVLRTSVHSSLQLLTPCSLTCLSEGKSKPDKCKTVTPSLNLISNTLFGQPHISSTYLTFLWGTKVF